MKFKKIKDGTCIKYGGGAEMYHIFFCQNQKLSGHSETQKTHTYLFKGGTIGTCIKISAKKDEN